MVKIVNNKLKIVLSPFQNGSSTSGILNKSTASGNFGCDDDLCRESESY